MSPRRARSLYDRRRDTGDLDVPRWLADGGPAWRVWERPVMWVAVMRLVLAVASVAYAVWITNR